MSETVTPAARITAAGEAIREHNHTSAAHSAYEYPSQVYDTYGQLVALLDRLAQTCHQAAGWIARETDRGGVAINDGVFVGDPQAAAAVVEHHSGQAAGALLAAVGELREAHAMVGVMASTRELGSDA